MWIKTTNEQLQAIYRDDLMSDHYDPPGVEFSDSGTANVVADVGERLVETYDTIEPMETDT